MQIVPGRTHYLHCMGTAEAGSRLGGPLASNSWNARPVLVLYRGSESGRKREINRFRVVGSCRKHRRVNTHTITRPTHEPHMDHIHTATADMNKGLCVENICHLSSYLLPLLMGGRGATRETRQRDRQDGEVHPHGAGAGSQHVLVQPKTPVWPCCWIDGSFRAEAELGSSGSGSWGCEPGLREPRVTGVRLEQPWPQKWRAKSRDTEGLSDRKRTMGSEGSGN